MVAWRWYIIAGLVVLGDAADKSVFDDDGSPEDRCAALAGSLHLLASNVLATLMVPTLAAPRDFHFWRPHHTHTKTVAHRDDLVSHLNSAEQVSVLREPH